MTQKLIGNQYQAFKHGTLKKLTYSNEFEAISQVIQKQLLAKTSKPSQTRFIHDQLIQKNPKIPNLTRENIRKGTVISFPVCPDDPVRPLKAALFLARNGWMQRMATGFNKAEVNICSDRCITTFHHKNFTPDELNCLQRCTRNMMRVGGWQRARSDSEELQLVLREHG